MSLQVTTDYGSLIALGVGAGDVASIISLGQRMGNWWTAGSGDKEFLALLDEDEFNIRRRRGLVDLLAFNKRWRKLVRLLANGRPMVFENGDAQKVLEDLGRFTAVMVCIVATLDRFASFAVVKPLLKSVLKELLKTSERGEDLLAAQYTTRLNAWRTTACLRGFSTEAEIVRQTLLADEVILSGLMPAGESRHMEEYLVWLWGGQSNEFKTSSSDVVGVAICLLRLGIDVISVEGLGFRRAETACLLVYSRESFLHSHTLHDQHIVKRVMREQSTTISLSHPEESVSTFPTPFEVHNRCRSAWKAGQGASNPVRLGVITPTREDVLNARSLEGSYDIEHSFIDRGTEPGRVATSELHDLASSHAPVINQELLIALEARFEHDIPATLSWLNLPTAGEGLRDDDIGDPGTADPTKIAAFCVFQSFFMGYYYSMFLRVADTSSLLLQMV